MIPTASEELLTLTIVLGGQWAGFQSLLWIWQRREFSLGLPKSDDCSHYVAWEKGSHGYHHGMCCLRKDWLGLDSQVGG